MKNFEYRDSSYFNDKDTFVFDSDYRVFESKVFFEDGYWWTKESMNFKATTVLCYNNQDQTVQ
jgi:hypothetical protein